MWKGLPWSFSSNAVFTRLNEASAPKIDCCDLGIFLTMSRIVAQPNALNIHSFNVLHEVYQKTHFTTPFGLGLGLGFKVRTISFGGNMMFEEFEGR